MDRASGERRQAWEQEAARRSAAARGQPTAEDRILRALLDGTAQALAEAASARARAKGIDQDYLAYWVDELGLQQAWRALD